MQSKSLLRKELKTQQILNLQSKRSIQAVAYQDYIILSEQDFESNKQKFLIAEFDGNVIKSHQEGHYRSYCCGQGHKTVLIISQYVMRILYGTNLNKRSKIILRMKSRTHDIFHTYQNLIFQYFTFDHSILTRTKKKLIRQWKLQHNASYINCNQFILKYINMEQFIYYCYEFDLITCQIQLKCKFLLHDLSIFQISKDYKYIFIENRVEKIVENQLFQLKKFELEYDYGKFTEDNLLILILENMIILYDLDQLREQYKIYIDDLRYLRIQDIYWEKRILIYKINDYDCNIIKILKIMND